MVVTKEERKGLASSVEQGVGEIADTVVDTGAAASYTFLKHTIAGVKVVAKEPFASSDRTSRGELGK